MKTISLAVSESDYEAFRKAATEGDRSIAQMIREAMAFYRSEHLESRKPLLVLPVLAGHRLLGALPRRTEYFDQMIQCQEESN